MEFGLVTKTFDVPTQFYTYPARFIAPEWAKGFECKSGICGLCCLTERPTSVPQIFRTHLRKSICGFYHLEKRICQKYNTRPLACKIYPFLFGVEEGQILVSTSLECPGVNSETDNQEAVILSVINDAEVGKQITLMNDVYETSVLLPHIWNNADSVWKTLSHRFQDYFSHNFCFPFLAEVNKLAIETVMEELDQEIPKIPAFSVMNLTQKTSGLYIATRFDSYSLCLVEVKGSKTHLVRFDNKLRETTNIKIDTPDKFLNLEIEKDAHRLLEDYVSFILNRPFLSLAALITTIEPRPAPFTLMSSLPGVFVPIEVGATLIAQRDNLNTIDSDTMREIISFSEPNTRNLFINPARARKFY